MEINSVRVCFFGLMGVIGGVLSRVFGGWGHSLTTLVFFMGIDYVSGLILAGVFHLSKKTCSGRLESGAGWRGVSKKVMTLLIVLIAARMGALVGLDFVRDAVVAAYIVNEGLSIVENAGLMGLPVPEVLNNAIEALAKKK